METQTLLTPQERKRSANREYMRRYRAAHPEAVREYERRWRAANPERMNEIRRRFRLKHGETLREKNRASARRWAEKNGEKARARTRQYFRDHPDRKSDHNHRRRARMLGTGIEPVSIARIIERDGMRCYLCSGDVTRQTFSVDHVIPLAKGGPHAESNLRVAHLACNVRKGTRCLAAS